MRRYILLVLLIKIVASITLAQTPTDSAALRALSVGYVLQPERVYLHFDNTSYFLGETIWFKAFVTSHNDDRATTKSRVLYVELVSPEGYVVKTNKYKIADNGTCHGEIFMNPSYLSGCYEIRAYTRYMLNWGDASIFSRVFPVYEKNGNGDWGYRNLRKRERRFMTADDWVKKADSPCSLKFYPEGGHLVAGIEGVVAFELKGAGGKASYDSITIIADGEPIIRTSPVHQGKGLFRMLPEKGVRYSAVVDAKNDEGKIKRYEFDIPHIEDEGVVVSVVNKNDSVAFSIDNNYSADTELGFAVLYRSSIGFYRRLHGKSSSFSLPKDSLPEGVCRAIVFSGKYPLAERLFFIRHSSLQKGDRQTVRLNATANGLALHNLELKPHEKVVLTISRDDGKPLEIKEGLAVSVTGLSSTERTSWGHDIYTWQLLGSELRGYIPDAWQYFNPENEKRDEYLDLIMLTHGWTAYDWSNLQKGNLNNIVPPEKGITIRGQLYRRLIGHSIGSSMEMKIKLHGNSPISLYVPKDSVVSMYVSRTDSAGCFVIETDDFYGNKIVALSPRKQTVQTKWVRDAFMLDRYFSPLPRSLSYWECNSGSSYLYGGEGVDNTIKNGTHSFDLPEFTIEKKRRRESYEREPISELRLNYVDEWEYAQDITFRYGIYDTANAGETARESRQTAKEDYIHKFISYCGGGYDSLFRYNVKENNYFKNLPESYFPGRYLFRDNLPQYADAITVSNVISSIFSRYGLPWCYWVMPAVVEGNYESGKRPRLDEEYLDGINVEKMTNFSEIIISSDKLHCNMFNGGEYFWRRFAIVDSISNMGPFWDKAPYSFFYDGFYKMKTIHPTRDEIRSEDKGFFEKLGEYNIQEMSTEELQEKVKTPNFVAFLVPSKADSTNVMMKVSLSGSEGLRRYTSLQGYCNSKEFYSPDYNSEPVDSGDYRRTLFWNHSVSSDDGKISVEFYNNCEHGSIMLNVAGIDNGIIYGCNEHIQTNCIAGDTIGTRPVGGDKVQSGGHEIRGLRSAEWCKKEFETAEIYLNQGRYRQSLDIYAELIQYDYVPAMHRLAQFYRDGTAVKQNPASSLKLYKECCNRGYAPSQYELAMAYLKGEWLDAAPDSAISWLEKAAEQGFSPALVELGNCYMKGEVITADTLLAADYYRQAALGNSGEALYKYALYMKQTGIERDTLLGSIHDCMSWAAEKGYGDALYFMVMHYDANGNYKAAYENAFALHLQGDTRGTCYVADCYYHGHGVKRDKSLAKDLYREAAAAGNEDAVRILQEW